MDGFPNNNTTQSSSLHVQYQYGTQTVCHVCSLLCPPGIPRLSFSKLLEDNKAISDPEKREWECKNVKKSFFSVQYWIQIFKLNIYNTLSE